MPEAAHKRFTDSGPGEGVQEVSRTVRLRDDLEVTFVFDAKLEDPQSKYIAETGLPWLEAPTELMLHLLRPGQAILDLGAHLGTFSLPAAAAGCRVIAVEASARNAAWLRASADRSGLRELRVIQAAASNRSGKISFGAHGPWGHVTKIAEVDDLPGMEVPALAVDDLLAEVCWPRVDLVKMDIEGWEPAAVEGMKRLLRRADAPAILFESNAHALAWYGHTPGKLLRSLEAFGYRHYLVDPVIQGRLVPVRSGDLQPEYLDDYLAVKRLPSGLSPWWVSAPYSRDELKNRLVTSCRQPCEPDRAYAALALRNAPAWLLADPAVREALRDLRADTSPWVRKTASWAAELDRRGAWLRQVLSWCRGRAA